MNKPCSDIQTLRSVTVNAITFSVAAGLTYNRIRNTEISRSEWAAGDPPFVDIIIPVRNEERNIGPLLTTLAAQLYPQERTSITVVDDGSSDGTAEIVAGFANIMPNLRLVHAPEPASGWTGKNNAIWTGYLHAHDQAHEKAHQQQRWLLFIDADTRHHPLMLASVIAEAERTGVDLLSLIIDVKMCSFWERLMVPQIGELYTLLVGTMDQVNSGKGSAANGQFMLVRENVYRQIGALPEVTGDVAEDRAFASACLASGYKLRLAYGRSLVSARVYSSFGELWAGYSKTLFWASGHSTSRTLLVVLALSLYALAPLVTLIRSVTSLPSQSARIWRHSVIQLFPLLFLRAYVCRLMSVPPVYALGYPVGVVVANTMLLYSLYRVKSGKGVVWKGRTYKR